MQLKLLAAVALVATCAPSIAAEWRHPLAVEGGTSLAIDHLVANEAGYVLIGADAAPWVNVDAAGHATVDRGVDPVAVPAQGDRQLFALDRDRFLFRPLAQSSTPQCIPQILDRAGRVTAIGTQDSCRSPQEDPPALDGAGGIWISSLDSTRWARLQQDGRVRTVALPPDASSPSGSFSPQPEAAAAYIVYQTVAGNRLAKMTPSGSAWIVDPPQPDVHLRSAHALADGDVLVVGQQGTRSSQDRLWLARYSPTGTLRWQRAQPDAAAGVQSDVRVLGGNRVAVAVRPNTSGGVATPVHILDGNGQLQRTLVDADAEFVRFVPGPSGDPREAPRQFAYFLGVRVAGVVGPSVHRIAHIDGDGVLLARHEIVAAPPAESVRALNRAALLVDGSLVLAHLAADGQRQLRHFAANGSARATPDLAGLVPRMRDVVRGAVGVDGDTYSLVRVPGQRLQLRAYARDGQLRWTGLLPAVTASVDAREDDVYVDRQGRIVAAADRVCVGPTFRRFGQISDILFATTAATCFDRDDGSLVRSVELLPGNSELESSNLLPNVEMRDASRVYLVEYGTRAGPNGPLFAVYRVTIDSDGIVDRDRLADTDIAFPSRPGSGGAQGANLVADVTPLGGVSVVLASSTGYALLTPVAGRSREFRYPNVDLGSVMRLQRQSDGSFVLHSRVQNRHQIRVLESDGRVRWTREFPVASETLADGHPSFLFASGGQRVVVMSQQTVNGRTTSTVDGLDLGNGSRRFRESHSMLAGRGVRALAVDEARRLAVILYDGPSEPLLALASLDGEGIEGKRGLGCAPAPGCSPSALVLDRDGSIRTFGGDVEAASYDLATTLDGPATAQRGLLGTWYAPGTTGQGLLFDVAPDNRTVMAAWFTYAIGDARGAPGLRWFTLVGSSTPVDGAIALKLYSNHNGQFGTPPRTESRGIGTARLQLRTCSEAVLSYDFRAEEFEGLEGDVPLRRLTGAAFDCIEADGRVVTAAGASGDPASGIGARQSGAWYEPASSGQGLLFDVRGPGANDAGHLVAGWFTYDVAGSADDASAHHWFLLDGSLAGAQSGSVTLPIYRATSGSFDRLPTSNVHRVGQARVQFSGCGAATLDYTFDVSDLAAEFAGKQGRLNLTKLLPCQP
jgi:hypothetical protein